MMLPPPSACGAPLAFPEWRAGQPEALTFVADSTADAWDLSADGRCGGGSNGCSVRAAGVSAA